MISLVRWLGPPLLLAFCWAAVAPMRTTIYVTCAVLFGVVMLWMICRALFWVVREETHRRQVRNSAMILAGQMYSSIRVECPPCNQTWHTRGYGDAYDSAYAHLSAHQGGLR